MLSAACVGVFIPLENKNKMNGAYHVCLKTKRTRHGGRAPEVEAGAARRDAQLGGAGAAIVVVIDGMVLVLVVAAAGPGGKGEGGVVVVVVVVVSVGVDRGPLWAPAGGANGVGLCGVLYKVCFL